MNEGYGVCDIVREIRGIFGQGGHSEMLHDKMGMGIGDYYSLPTRERKVVRERLWGGGFVEVSMKYKRQVWRFIQRIENAHERAGRSKLVFDERTA